MLLPLQIPFLSVSLMPSTGLARADANVCSMNDHTNLRVSTSARTGPVHAQHRVWHSCKDTSSPVLAFPSTWRDVCKCKYSELLSTHPISHLDPGEEQ